VLGVGGLENLGGLDVDDALIGHLGHVIAARDPARWQRLTRPSGPAELRERRALWAEVRAAKEMLSRTTSAPVPVPGGGDPLHLTREELDRLAGPLIDRAVDETRRLLDGVSRSAGPVSLGGILLVGGSSRIPLVATRLHGRFGVAPMVPEQPELPVALGALGALADGPAGGAYGDGAGHGAPRSVSGGPGGGFASGQPASGPVSGVPGGAPVSAASVSGDTAGAWSGRARTAGDAGSSTGDPWTTDQPSWPPAVPGPNGPATHPGQPGPYGPQAQLGAFGSRPGQRRTRGPRGATLVAIAASLALLLLAGGTIWFVRDALGSGEGGSGGDKPAAAGTTPASSTSPAPLPPAFTGYAWCEAPDKRIFCPIVPKCFDAEDEETACAGTYTTQIYAAGYLTGDGVLGSTEAIVERPEVKGGCNKDVMAARSIDKTRTADWDRYVQWGWTNGQNLFYCLAGPKGEGETKGSAFKPAT
jgi:hypothetical protein